MTRFPDVPAAARHATRLADARAALPAARRVVRAPLPAALLVAVTLAAGCLAPGAEPSAAADARSPYVDQVHAEIRGMTGDEIRDLREGAGAGFARAAELNGYPGPRHALDLAVELELTPAQRSAMEWLYDSMNADARAAGAVVLEREAELERAFRDGFIDAAELDARLAEIAAARADLRGIHLHAHLAALDELTAEQVARYDELRGYAGGSEHASAHDPAAPSHG